MTKLSHRQVHYLMEQLKSELNGKCSQVEQSCPRFLSHMAFKHISWGCYMCIDNFIWLKPGCLQEYYRKITGLRHRQPELTTIYANPCPCKVVKDIDLLLARIDELIEDPTTFIF